MRVTRTGSDEWVLVCTEHEARVLKEGMVVAVTLADDRERGAIPTWAQDLEARADGARGVLADLGPVPAWPATTSKAKGKGKR